MVVFYALPVASMLFRSVADPAWTMENYVAAAATGFLHDFWTTLRTALVVTLGALLLGYPVALALSRLRHAAARHLDHRPVAVLDQRAGAQLCLDGAAGPQGSGQRGVARTGLIDAPLRLLNTPLAVHIAMIHILLPYMILPIASVAAADRGALPRAAAGLGAPPWRVPSQVILPLSMPGVAAGILLVFVLSLGFYITPALVGGPRDLMLSMLIAQQVDLLNWAYAACLSVDVLATTLLIIVACRRLRGRAATFR